MCLDKHLRYGNEKMGVYSFIRSCVSHSIIHSLMHQYLMAAVSVCHNLRGGAAQWVARLTRNMEVVG